MPMLPARHYNSDANQFLREFVARRPEVVEKQEEGMKIWWGHDPEAVKAQREAERAADFSLEDSEDTLA